MTHVPFLQSTREKERERELHVILDLELKTRDIGWLRATEIDRAEWSRDVET